MLGTARVKALDALKKKKKERKKERKKKTKMTKLDFHRFQVRHFSNNFEQSYSYCEDGATPKSRSKCLWTFKNHHQAKYQRVNANTLYVAAILFSCSTLHRETLPCLPNKKSIVRSVDNCTLKL